MKNLNPYNLTFVKVEDHDITPRERQIVDKKYDQCFKYKNPKLDNIGYPRKRLSCQHFDGDKAEWFSGKDDS